MSDLDRAYRVLGLERGAPLEEVEEAYQDLKSVWQPDRFADSPKLRSKAEEKQQAVEHAYQTLRDQLTTEGAGLGEVVEPGASEDSKSGRGPSILDDTLSERIGKSKRRFPVWIALFGLVGAAVVISFLTWSPVDVDSEPQLSETEQILDDIRASENEDSEAVDLLPADDPEPVSAEELDEPLVSQQPSPPPVDSKTSVRPEREPVSKPARSEPPVTRPPLERKPVPAEPTTEIPEEPQENVEREDEAVEEEPAISELAERSFQILRAKSDLANQLIEGSLAKFNYKNWKAVERSSTEVYVDLVAEVVAEGREVHFVWAVDLEAQSVKAMSQAARDLEAGGL
jgi:curved DNA-binding protein CbpA